MIQKNLLKILFVEYLPSDVDLAVLELRKEKIEFEYITVCTRIDMVSALKKFNPDLIIKLILMDMKMPEIDGFEATRQIKLIEPDVTIIAITAHAMSGDEERIIAAGCDGYLSKPINKKSLLEKMAEFVSIR